jgi:hypothetical protein
MSITFPLPPKRVGGKVKEPHTERETTMPQFRVTWEIDLEVDSAQAAAAEALEIQRDPENEATVFRVTLMPEVPSLGLAVAMQDAEFLKALSEGPNTEHDAESVFANLGGLDGRVIRAILSDDRLWAIVEGARLERLKNLGRTMTADYAWGAWVVDEGPESL